MQQPRRIDSHTVEKAREEFKDFANFNRLKFEVSFPKRSSKEHSVCLLNCNFLDSYADLKTIDKPFGSGVDFNSALSDYLEQVNGMILVETIYDSDNKFVGTRNIELNLKALEGYKRPYWRW